MGYINTHQTKKPLASHGFIVSGMPSDQLFEAPQSGWDLEKYWVAIKWNNNPSINGIIHFNKGKTTNHGLVKNHLSVEDDP